MLDSRWRKILRDLSLHRGRTLLVVLAIATGLAGAASILVKYALVTRATSTDYLASNPPAARLHVDRVTGAAIDRVGELDGVDEVEVRRTVAGSIWIDGERDSVTIVAADDLERLAIGRIASKEGRWPRDGEVAVERSSLRRTPIAIGTDVGLAVSTTEPTRLPVVGILHDVGVAPAWMEQRIYLYTTPATLAILGEPTDPDEIRFTVADPNLDRGGVRRIARLAVAAVEDLGVRVEGVVVPPPGQHIHAGQMNSLFFVQAALGLLALLFSATLVFNLMTALLTGQVREIGMMKAIGASTAQVAGLYLVMVGILGVAASALAIPVASVAGRKYAALTLLALNFEPGDVRTPPWALLLPAAVGIVLPVLAAAVPVYRGARRSVAEAIRDDAVAGLRGGGRARRPDLAGLPFLARLGLSRPLLLSLRNTLRRRGRLALTLLSLTVGGALFMGALNLRASIRQSVERWFIGTEDDLRLRLARGYPPAELEGFLAQIPGVVAVEAQGGVSATLVLPEGGTTDPFPLLIRSVDSPFVGSRLLAGRWLAASRDGPGRSAGELVVNRGWVARVHPARVGDTLTLRVAGRESSWEVVGILDASPLSTVAYTSRLDRGRLVDDAEEASSALVRLDPTNRGLVTHIEMVRQRDGGAEPSFIERLHGIGPDPSAGLDDPRTVRSEAPRLLEVILEGAGYPVRDIVSMQDARRGLVDHMVLVVDLLWVMSLLVIAVGGFGLATTMSLTVLERTREIGVLRAIGADHSAIRRIVVAEAMTIALVSWIVAVPLALPMGAWLGSVFGRIMMQMPIRFGGAPLAAGVWLVLILALSVVASLWPAIRATRVTTREALSRR